MKPRGLSATVELFVKICERTDRQTNRHAETLIAILRQPAVVEVKNDLTRKGLRFGGLYFYIYYDRKQRYDIWF